MAVVALFMSDRDPSTTFTSKKDADEWDKTLELAEAVSDVLGKHMAELNEAQLEHIGLLIAKNKATFATACKGRADVLYEQELVPASEKPKVVPIKAEG
jgi:hypothetical protein